MYGLGDLLFCMACAFLVGAVLAAYAVDQLWAAWQEERDRRP